MLPFNDRYFFDNGELRVIEKVYQRGQVNLATYVDQLIKMFGKPDSKDVFEDVIQDTFGSHRVSSLHYFFPNTICVVNVVSRPDDEMIIVAILDKRWLVAQVRERGQRIEKVMIWLQENIAAQRMQELSSYRNCLMPIVTIQSSVTDASSYRLMLAAIRIANQKLIF